MSARIESLAHTIREALHFPPTTKNMDTCRGVAEKVAALDGEDAPAKCDHIGNATMDHALALVEAAMATHALVAEALRKVVARVDSMQSDALREAKPGSVMPMGDPESLAILRAADAALAPSALEASGRRFRVMVREQGKCSRCGCDCEVAQPGKPDEFTSLSLWCRCTKEFGRCEVARS